MISKVAGRMFALEGDEYLLEIILDTTVFAVKAKPNSVFPQNKAKFIAKLHRLGIEPSKVEDLWIERGDDTTTFDFTGCGFVNMKSYGLPNCNEHPADLLAEMPRLTKGVIYIKPDEKVFIAPQPLCDGQRLRFEFRLLNCNPDLCCDLRGCEKGILHHHGGWPASYAICRTAKRVAARVVVAEYVSRECHTLCEVIICPKKPLELGNTAWYESVEDFEQRNGKTVWDYLCIPCPFQSAKWH